MRVIIAGSRSVNDYNLVKDTMDFLFGKFIFPTVVLCGGAKGPDLLGKQYAKANNIEVEMYLADWKKFGKSAGYRRNKMMARDADCLVAFWDGESNGTEHMIELAKDFGLDMFIFTCEGEKG